MLTTGDSLLRMDNGGLIVMLLLLVLNSLVFGLTCLHFKVKWDQVVV